MVYQLVTWDQLIENKKPEDDDKFQKFQQTLQWPNKTSYVCFILILYAFYLNFIIILVSF